MTEMTNSSSNHSDQGQPIGVLAHDIGNLLLVVTWSSRQLLGQIADDHPDRSVLQSIYDAGAQASQLARQLQEQTKGNSSDTVELVATDYSSGNQSQVAQTGTGTILLVDDDRQVLDLIQRRLERCGYTVLSAQRGQDAIALAIDHDDCIHLLITDLSLPDLPGREVVESIRQHYPGLPALILSGYAPDQGQPPPQDEFLQKPFKSAELLAKVAEIIGRT